MTEPIYDPKHGFIRTPNGFVEHTTEHWRPRCPDCNAYMRESQHEDIFKKTFIWWCGERNCNYSQMANKYLIDAEKKRKAEEPVDYSRYGIPSYLEGMTFDSISGMIQTVKKLKAFTEKPDNVFLKGGTGTGKTHLAIATLKTIIDNGNHHCYFQSVPSLIMDINNAYRNDDSPQGPKQIIERYINYKVLVLDDFGAEKVTENVQNVLYMIINGRLERYHHTLITSNSSIHEIEKSHGERLASRLKSYVNLSTAGKDRRGANE